MYTSQAPSRPRQSDDSKCLV